MNSTESFIKTVHVIGLRHYLARDQTRNSVVLQTANNIKSGSALVNSGQSADTKNRWLVNDRARRKVNLSQGKRVTKVCKSCLNDMIIIESRKEVDLKGNIVTNFY